MTKRKGARLWRRRMASLSMVSSLKVTIVTERVVTMSFVRRSTHSSAGGTKGSHFSTSASHTSRIDVGQTMSSGHAESPPVRFPE